MGTDLREQSLSAQRLFELADTITGKPLRSAAAHNQSPAGSVESYWTCRVPSLDATTATATLPFPATWGLTEEATETSTSAKPTNT